LHCKDFGSLSVVRTIEPSRSDAHLTIVPSVRTTCHIVQTSVRPSIIRPDDVHFRPDPPLNRDVSIQLASIRTFQQHVRTPLGTRPVSDSFQVPIKERSSNRLDNVVSRQDARLRKARIAIQISPSGRLSVLVRKRATNMEIANSTSTVRTIASHGSDARIADMEIVCCSSAV
jgi:hypothetical protein